MIFSSVIKGQNQKPTISSSFKFCWNKIRTIYPTLIFSYLLSLIIYIDSRLSAGQSTVLVLEKSAFFLIFDSALLQSLTGIYTISTSLNGVAWFLSCLAIIYLLSPIIVFALRKFIITKKRAFFSVLVSFALYISFWLIGELIDGHWKFDYFSYSTPYVRLWLVVLGMNIGLLYCFIDKSRISKKVYNVLETLLIVLSLLWFAFRTSLSLYIPSIIIRIIDVLLCTSLVMLFSFSGGYLSKLLSSNFFFAQSKYTSYIYLLHLPCCTLISYFFYKLTIVDEKIIWLILLLTILCFSLLSFMAKKITDFVLKRKKQIKPF